MSGNSMRAADTNILVRLIVRDDPPQVAAAEAFLLPGAWASHLVLAECAFVLGTVYEFDAAQIAAALDMFLAHSTLMLQDPDVVALALAHFRRKPSLGFFDCLALEIARKAGHLPFGTFDRDLAKLDGAQRI